MLIKIFNSKGIEQVELSPNDNSTLSEEIQGDSVLALSFTHFDHIELDVDFYTDFEGKRYWLTEKYRPKQNNSKEWVYNVKMYGVESMLKRLLVIKTVDNEEDPVFTLTAPPREHVALIVGCMNRGMGNISDWKVGQVDGVENIVVDYFGKYCDEALKEIAEKVGAEWWIQGQTVNICKCEHGEPVELGYRKGLLSIDPGMADNVKFYTRLYPVGSSRNIDKDHYGYTRLQLPDGKKYIEVNADKYGRVDHYEQDAFSGIYPRRVGTVSNVRSEERIGEDGDPFTIYYFTDDSLNFDPNDYLMPERVIRVSFQEGSELGGLGNEDNGTYYFEVNYDSSRKEFEIITIWPYGNDMQLPGDLLVPKTGDRYILWNLRMPDEYYKLAEQEFLDAVNRYNEDHALDVAVYKAPTDHVWLEQNKISLSIGRRIRLESREYFPESGYRDSRITRITRKVNLPSSLDIEISDALSRTSQQKMNDEISGARNYIESLGQTVSLPDIVRTGDDTILTDNNLLSALRVVAEISKRAISKLTDDQAKGLIRFLAGLETGSYIENISGGKIDKDGNAELEDLYVRGDSVFKKNLSSPDFISGFLGGKGWSLIRKEVYNALGVPEDKYVLEIDELIVRGVMRVYEFVISQLLGENDNRIFTAMLKVDHYDAQTGRIWLDTQGGKFYNPFRPGDYIMVQQYNGMPSEANNYYVTKQYELIVKEVGVGDLTDKERLDWITFSNFVSPSGMDPERAIAQDDVLVRTDNLTDDERKGIMQIIAVGAATPYMDVIYGLKTDPDDYLKVRLGNLKGIRHHLFGWLQGFGLFSQNAYLVGDFRLGRTGDSIDAQIQMLKDRFASQYSEITYTVTEEENYLLNATFTENMEHWEVISDDSSLVMLPEGDAMLVNGNLLLTDSKKAQLTEYEGRQMLLVVNSGIRQLNQYIRKPGTHNIYDSSKGIATTWDTYVEGNIDGSYIEKRDTLYLTIKFLAATSGNLTLGFRGASSDVDSLPNPVTVHLDASSEWQIMQWDGTWDGKGDFVLEYTGTMYLQLLSLTSDPLADYKQEMGTRIEQTARNIKLIGYNIDQKQGVMHQQGIDISNLTNTVTIFAEETRQNFEGVDRKISEIVVSADAIRSRVEIVENGVKTNASMIEQKANEINLTVTDFKNNLVSYINQSPESIKIHASKVELSGDVTINNVIKITEDGDILFDGILKQKAIYDLDVYLAGVVHLPPLPEGLYETTLTPRMTGDSCGQVIRLFNSTPAGQTGTYVFYDTSFTIGATGSNTPIRANYLKPQECMEFTCFRTGENTALWKMTGRFSTQDQHGEDYRGRYPLQLASGTIDFNVSNRSLSLSGKFHNGNSLSSAGFTVERTDFGMYTLHFPSSAFPMTYFVICQSKEMYAHDGNTSGLYGASASVSVVEKTSTSIRFICSDDDTTNDCSFDFIIFNHSDWA